MKPEYITAPEKKVLTKLMENHPINNEHYDMCLSAVNNCHKIDSRSLLQFVINVCNDYGFPLLELFIDDDPDEELKKALSDLLNTFITPETTIGSILNLLND